MSIITTKELVEREVYYCASTLISELAKDEKYMDELLPIMIQDDWETAAKDAGFKHCFAGSWQTVCEDNNVDPYQNEAYEHWIISGWLADKLEAKGEMILRDFMGMTLWGRACTGQAICMDSVIEEIHSDLVKGGHKKAAAMDAFINARG